MSERYLCIHGHFYQPPRENPWTGEIELQKSASPFHDWNERIHHECYLPNAKARVLDNEGRITDIVNNFERISFNFGPTLLSWLEAKHPETYRAILSADARSASKKNGHGNAIAQVYNHVIMPLASRRDKVTQVRWGVEDFRFRFGRDPESIWLAETAANEETLEVLVEAGIRFLILSPHQAEAARRLDGDDWKDASHGNIDPKMPYRCFLKSDPAKFIDIFFYDGPISKAAGFEDLLFDSRRFVSRIENAVSGDRHENQLISLATDGETFGHHKAYGDRVLAYATSTEAPAKGFRVVNYAEYLEAHPPKWAVRLKEGQDAEGTAWSCPHGVKRWKDHCGCRGGGPAHWNQHWRKGLRDALDWLSARAAGIYEEQGGRFFKDVWAVRDAYVRVVLDRSERNVERFFAQHAVRPLERAEIVACLKLLEMQRHMMFAYTSCGWFFSEISGIETIQVLQYAARAIELAGEAGGPKLEPEFLERLEAAKSNLPELRDGRGVYERYVRPSVTGAAKIVGQYAIFSVFDELEPEWTGGDFRFEVLHRRKESFSDLLLNYGRVAVVSRSTLESHDFYFAVLQFGAYDFRASVIASADIGDAERVERELFELLHSGHVVDMMRRIDASFGTAYYDLKDLFLAERQKILSILSKEAIAKISAIQEELYDESRRMNDMYRSINLPIPEEIRYAAAHTLTKRLSSELRLLAAQGFDWRRAQSVFNVIDLARKMDVDLKKEDAAAFLAAQLARRAKVIAYDTTLEAIEEALRILRIASTLDLEIDKRSAQDDIFSLLKKWREYPETVSILPKILVEALFQLASSIEINARDYKPRFLNV